MSFEARMEQARKPHRDEFLGPHSKDDKEPTDRRDERETVLRFALTPKAETADPENTRRPSPQALAARSHQSEGDSDRHAGFLSESGSPNLKGRSWGRPFLIGGAGAATATSCH